MTEAGRGLRVAVEILSENFVNSYRRQAEADGRRGLRVRLPAPPKVNFPRLYVHLPSVRAYLAFLMRTVGEIGP